jgi:hypothetical protein
MKFSPELTQEDKTILLNRLEGQEKGVRNHCLIAERRQAPFPGARVIGPPFPLIH